MVPIPGDKVKLTRNFIEFIERKYGDFPQVMGRLDKLRGKNFIIQTVEASVQDPDWYFVMFDYDNQGIHVDKCGHYWNSNGVVALEYVGASPRGDCCPDCGHIGQIVCMACVCQNPSCPRHVIWGI